MVGGAQPKERSISKLRLPTLGDLNIAQTGSALSGGAAQTVVVHIRVLQCGIDKHLSQSWVNRPLKDCKTYISGRWGKPRYKRRRFQRKKTI